MRISPRARKIAIGISLSLMVLLLLAFPFGPLLPWSPLKPGYRSVSYAHADLAVARREELPADLGDLDAMFPEAEAFHGLKYQKRVRIVLCKDWADCERGMPWMNVHPLGGATLVTGDAIYITPKLREKHFSTREFLRHELSHALVSQNTSVRSSIALLKLPWLFEGMAVSFGRQHDYLSRAEFLSLSQTTELVDYIDPARGNVGGPNWNARFAYPAQRYFIEYLRDRFGDARFLDFMHRFIAAPGQGAGIFNEAFGRPLPQAVREYQQALRAPGGPGQWLPTEE